jgi:hypothetical protein
LSIDGTPTSYREDVSFDADETQTLTFAWGLEDGDKGDHTAEVCSGTDSASTGVTVEECDGAPDPGAFSVFIESAPSEVGYPNEDATVSADVYYAGSVSTRVTVRLEEDAPGSVGPTADFSEITMSPGETRTLSLTWDRVDLVPDYFVPGDVQLCVEADRDGVPGVQDSDCTTVTVAEGNTYVVDETVSVTDPRDNPGRSSTTVETDVSARYVKLSWEYESDVTSDPAIDETVITHAGRSITLNVGTGDASGSGTYDFGSVATGDLVLETNDGTATVSPP